MFLAFKFLDYMKHVPMNLYVLCLEPFGSKTKLEPKISFFEKISPNIYC